MAEMAADGQLRRLQQRECPPHTIADADCILARSRLARVVEIRDQLEAHANPDALAVLHAAVAKVRDAPSGCDAPPSSLVAARRAVLLHVYSFNERANFDLEIEGDDPGPCFHIPTIGGELGAVVTRDHRDELHPHFIRLGVARPFDPDRDGWVADELAGRPELAGSRVALVEISGVCGGLCGQGEDHAVAFVDGGWIYLGSSLTWIASLPEQLGVPRHDLARRV